MGATSNWRCSGVMDTKTVGDHWCWCVPPLVCLMGNIVECRMTTAPVLEHLRNLEEGRTRLTLEVERPPGKEFALHGSEDAFGHAGTEAATDRSHGTLDAYGLAALTKHQRSMLPAMVSVLDGTLLRSSPSTIPSPNDASCSRPA